MATGMFSGGAAFGVFPQMQPRRRLQDPVGAANVPLDVTRGRFAGLAGLLPDALNFMGRSPMPTEMFGETQYEPTQQLPYGSEYFLQNLPLKPTSRIGEVAGQAGAFVPLNPMPAARAVAAGARALGPTAVGMGERYLQSKGLMPGVVEGESAGLLGGPIKPQAPVSELGFYSAAEQAALNLPRKSGTGESFLNDLMKGQDVKKDELSWLGLDDYLKGKPNVTRQEVQDYIAGNRVDVREVKLGGNEAPSQDLLSWMSARSILPPRNPEGWQELSQKLERYAQQHQKAQGTPEASQRYFTLSEEAGRISEGLNAGGSSAGATKYQQYQLPGGENYREILLTMPNQWDKPRAAQIANEAKIKALRQEMYGTSGTNEIRSEISRLQNENTALQKQISEAPIYTSSHFNQPNILAHMRVNDRVDADGKKMLLIEEIQSDWHQAGREKGYQGKGTLKELPDNYFVQEIKTIDGDTMYVVRDNNNPGVVLNKDYNKQSAINGVINELNATSAGGVPDAPFKDTWHQLALKRALKYAADNGYDRVGLTTGRQQAERYDLSKQISEVHYSGTNFKAYDLDGKAVIFRTGVKPEDLAGLIGKEPAKKLLEQPKQGTLQSLTGQNLDVGGEGMKKYYDEIYPAFLAKQGKKYNAKTGETTIGLPPKTSNSWAYFRDWFAENHSNVGGGSTALANWERGANNSYVKEFEKFRKTATQNENIRYIDISPEMRGSVKKGQPLFTAAPIGGIGLGAGTQDNEMPDAVRQYMADPRYSDPFADTTR